MVGWVRDQTKMTEMDTYQLSALAALKDSRSTR
jgi:hypothetical protein